MTNATYTTENGKTYEINLHDDSWYADYLGADVECSDTGRAYWCDFNDAADEDAEEAQQIEQALEAAREWCEWHSKREIENERYDEPNGIYWLR